MLHPKSLVQHPRFAAKIVIAGNGLGGLATVSAFRQQWKQLSGHDIVVLGQSADSIFKPLLLDTLTNPLKSSVSMGKAIPPGASSPLKFVQTAIQSIDLPHHRLETSQGPISFDYLVVALGNVRHSAGKIPGLEAHARFIDSPADIVAIRQSVQTKVAQALKAPEGSEQKRRLLSFVIMGAGPTGIETAFFLKEFINCELQKQKAHPGIQPVITLIHGSSTVLSDPYFRPIQSMIVQKLKKSGIQLLLNHVVSRVDSDSVIVTDTTTRNEKKIDTQSPISALGGIPNPLGASLGKANQRIPVNAFLELPAHPNVYVIGDLADAKDSKGNSLPMLGQVAVQQGKFVTKDILGKLKGLASPRLSFKYRHQGIALAAGSNDAVLQISHPWFGSHLLTGQLASWLRNALYHLKMRNFES